MSIHPNTRVLIVQGQESNCPGGKDITMSRTWEEIVNAATVGKLDDVCAEIKAKLLIEGVSDLPRDERDSVFKLLARIEREKPPTWAKWKR